MEIKTLQAATFENEGQTMIDVPWQVVDGDTVLQEGRQTFPLSATADDVKSFLSQALETYKAEVAQREEEVARQAALEAVNEVVASVSNLTVN